MSFVLHDYIHIVVSWLAFLNDLLIERVHFNTYIYLFPLPTYEFVYQNIVLYVDVWQGMFNHIA